MSYDLRIWEHPAHLPMPTTLEEAGKIMLALEGTKAPINPRFIELARQSVAHYPSQADDIDNAVWAGDPVHETQTCDEAVYAISLLYTKRMGIMRLVVDTAMALGLTVFDDQIGMAFLPSGEVLPKEQSVS